MSDPRESFELFATDTPDDGMRSVQPSFAVPTSEAYEAIRFDGTPESIDAIRRAVAPNKVEFSYIGEKDWSVLLTPKEGNFTIEHKPFISLRASDYHYRVEIGMWVLTRPDKTLAVSNARLESAFELYSIKEYDYDPNV